MKSTSLGEFEELVLLVVGALKEEAYGNMIKKEIAVRTKRNPSIGALHSALYRLEDKGFLHTSLGGATKERGGRRKKYYQLSEIGVMAIQKAYELRNELYSLIPQIKTQ